ncbi:hypothetical protein BV20DRAFT_576728 [Pilatotrama ljubarskyi]|nr:hypothetical protein BV20DRAFT_576728 [Pilatotrama ljubarskyi]
MSSSAKVFGFIRPSIHQTSSVQDSPMARLQMIHSTRVRAQERSLCTHGCGFSGNPNLAINHSLPAKRGWFPSYWVSMGAATCTHPVLRGYSARPFREHASSERRVDMIRAKERCTLGSTTRGVIKMYTNHPTPNGRARRARRSSTVAGWNDIGSAIPLSPRECLFTLAQTPNSRFAGGAWMVLQPSKEHQRTVEAMGISGPCGKQTFAQPAM